MVAMSRWVEWVTGAGRCLAAGLLAGLVVTAADAQDAAVTPPGAAPDLSAFDTAYDLLQVPRLLEIMADEGVAYGDSLQAEMFPGRGGDGWRTQVAAIYDPARMAGVFRDTLEPLLDPATLTETIAFFGSPDGRQLITLEITAREAMLDDAVEEASLEEWRALRAREAPLVSALEAFVEVNDLVESNVVGAMNSNFAFFSGLAEGGALPGAMSEAEMLADVWAQEAAIREETEDWVYSYLSLAYRPLPEGVLEDYTTFSMTPEGQKLNSALFAAFDALFTDISYSLGLSASAVLAAEDL